MPFTTTLALPQLLEACRISSGPLRNAYRKAPEGLLQWYFANLGLTGFITGANTTLLGYIHDHIGSYLAHVDRTHWTIPDYFVDDHGQITGTADSDADDSTAATFLSLVCAYTRTSKDRSFMQGANLTALKHIAVLNLITPRIPGTALTTPFQNNQTYALALVEDNCEVYRALQDFADCLHAYNLPDAALYSHYAQQSETAVLRAFGNEPGKWSAAMDLSGVFIPNDTKALEPDGTVQLFPTIYAIGATPASQQAGYTYISHAYSGWPSRAYGDFPWLMLAYAAALLGYPADTNAKLRLAETMQPWQLTINELGWAQRSLQLP